MPSSLRADLERSSSVRIACSTGSSSADVCDSFGFAWVEGTNSVISNARAIANFCFLSDGRGRPSLHRRRLADLRSIDFIFILGLRLSTRAWTPSFQNPVAKESVGG